MRRLFPFLYDAALFFLFLFYLPKLVWGYFFYGKYRKSFLSRIRPKNIVLQRCPNQKVIWLHSISLGETKALSTLVPHIRKAHPEAFILISTITETGQNEAKKGIIDADAYCYLPFDFSWIIRRFVQKIKPDCFILMESDYWYNLLHEVKKIGAPIILVNGKLSQRSLQRYLLCKSFSHRLFHLIDLFCLQSENYYHRFLQLDVDPKKMVITGNLKFDIPTREVSEREQQIFKQDLGIHLGQLVITIGSTHEKEEEVLIEAIRPLWEKFPTLKIILVPRHPERFKKVEKLLIDLKISYFSLSNKNIKRGSESIILVDQMGILPRCYQIADLSIVGGSFIKGIGGHDVFEPAKMGIPVIFGPHMDQQADLSRLVIQSGVGKQVALKDLSSLLEKYLLHSNLRKEDGAKGKELSLAVIGSSYRTWEKIEPFLRK